MSKRNNVKALSILSLSLALLPMLFFFQNCSSPAGSTISEYDSFSDASKDAKIEQAPFSFDSTVSQISYMSCTLTAYDNGSKTGLNDQDAYYTFRVSAEDTSGVTLSEEFKTYIEKGFKHIDGTIDEDLVKRAMLEAPANENAQLQIAIRSRSNFESGVLRTGSAPELGTEYNNLAVPLANEYVVGNLYNNSPNRVNYFTGGTGVDNRHIIGSLYFQNDESLGQQVRDNLVNNFLLSLTYTETSDLAKSAGYMARANSANKTIGTGFKIGYTLPHATSTAEEAALLPTDFGGPASPAVVMSSISEVNLATGVIDTSAHWVCPAEYRYKIIPIALANTAGTTYCPGPTEAVYNAHLAEMETIYRHLPAAKWRVNPELKCAVPLIGSCYPVEDVDYTGTEACGLGNPKDCAHYISICVRQ